MSEIQLDIPNIVVLVNNDPDYRKVIVKPDSNFNVNINVPRLVSRVSGSFIQFAETALTASYALTANRLIDSGTLQLGYISASAMWISESVYVGGLLIGTSSHALTASYALNAAAGAGFPYSGSAVITGSLLVISTGSVGGITGSLLGTASIAENITVIFAGIYQTGSDNPIVPTPSGGVVYVTSASYAITSSYAQTASSVQYNNITNKPTLVSSSTQIDYNLIQNKPTNVNSASFASSSVSASYAVTASSVTYANVTNKPTLVSASSQIIANQIIGISTYATTASNIFTDIQTVSDTTNSTLFTNGALVIQGGVGIAKDVNISGSLNILGTLTVATMSTQYVTSSQYTVGTSRVIVNSDNLVRFAGISAVDSGSTYGTGSLLWDSFNNRWIYEADDQAYNSAVIIAGPKNTGTLGDEPGLVIGRIPVASGDDHIDNRPESSSIRVDFPSRLTHIEAGLRVTGSVNTTAGFTGSLLGTSSNAQSSSVATFSSFANTASYALGFSGSIQNAISSSYSLTSSYALNGAGGGGVGFPFSGSAVITGSLIVSSSGIQSIGAGFTGSLFGTASHAITSSYIYGGVLIEEGLNITGSVDISGSLHVLGNITGSLLGTSSWSTNTVSSSFSTSGSFALNTISSSYAITSSYALNVSGSINNATSASYALTASYALNGGGGGGGAGFPYSGSAVITGSLLISGSPNTELTVVGDTSLTGSLLADTDTLTVSGSLLTTADTLIFTGSFASTGSFSMLSDADTLTISGSLLSTADTLIFSGSSYFSGSTFIYGESYIDGGTY